MLHKKQKILYLCDASSIFNYELLRQFKNEKFDITLLNIGSEPKNFDYSNLLSEKNIFQLKYNQRILKIPIFGGLYRVLLLFNKLITFKRYDIIHIQFVATDYSILAPLLNYKSNKLILSFWGSDIYRISQLKKYFQKTLIKSASNITFTNEITEEFFNSTTDNKYINKTKTIRFGVELISYLEKIRLKPKLESKKYFDLPFDKKILTIGYNGRVEQQHLKIIKELDKLDIKEKNKIHIICPMTYLTNKKYVNEIANKLSQYNISFSFITKYLSIEELAKLRHSSDYMINFQTTDQFSASVLEYMYTDNIVISGKWLPYDSMKKNKLFFIESDFNDLLKEIKILLNNEDKYLKNIKNNYNIVNELLSWENNIKKWIKLYEDKV